MFKHPVFSLTRLGAACAAVAAIAVAQPVFAQAQAPAPAAAAESAANRSPELTLQAMASSEVKQDTVRIALSAEVEAPDQPTAGQKLTAALEDVVKRARDTKDVEVRTSNFNVWPNMNNKG
ncbi:MAG: SIMPL domain-containing protein, partial [Achromobacter mucicolens]